MFSSIVNRIRAWNSERRKSAEEEEAKVLSVTTFSGSKPPGNEIKILGTVAADGIPKEARRSIRLQASDLGANYIINYREEQDGWTGFRCFGDAVVVDESAT